MLRFSWFILFEVDFCLAFITTNIQKIVFVVTHNENNFLAMKYIWRKFSWAKARGGGGGLIRRLKPTAIFKRNFLFTEG
jgi:hypothetical protein